MQKRTTSKRLVASLSFGLILLLLGSCTSLSDAWQSLTANRSKTSGSTYADSDPGDSIQGSAAAVNLPRPAMPTPPADNAARQMDVSKYRTWKPSERVRTVAYAVQQAAYTGSDSAMKALAEYLTREATDPLVAIKNLHDWVALYTSYDAKAFFAGAIPSQDPSDVLRRHTAVCAGYAALFKRLATLAGFETVVVSGYSRGFGYDPFVTEVPKANHDWNAVHVNGAWYLLDVTWDSGYLRGAQFVGEYSNDYFLLSPQKMIYTHMPTDPAWQLLEHPLSPNQCVALPYLRGEFFRYPFDNYTQLTGSYNCETELTVPLSRSGDFRVDAQLFEAEGAPVRNAVLTQTKNGLIEILIRPPHAGAWRLRVFAGANGGTRLEDVWETGVHSSGGNTGGYPLAYSSFQEMGCSLDSPLDGRLHAEQPYHFRLEVPGALELILDNGGRRTTFRAGAGSSFEFDYTPAVSGRLDVSELPARSSTYWTILRYEVAR